MLILYPAIFHEDSQLGYWVEFPNFGGGTEGDSLAEAMENAIEMLEGIVEVYGENNIPLPKASDFSEVVVDGFIKRIEVDF